MALLSLPLEPDAHVQDQHDSTSVAVASFGDGYEQRVGKGLNGDLQTWSISYLPRRWPDIQTLASFFGSHKVTPFLWAPPGEATQKKFKCVSFSKESTEFEAGVSQTTSVWSLTATIKEVPDL